MNVCHCDCSAGAAQRAGGQAAAAGIEPASLAPSADSECLGERSAWRFSSPGSIEDWQLNPPIAQQDIVIK
jgi:hypothetical protein